MLRGRILTLAAVMLLPAVTMLSSGCGTHGHRPAGGAAVAADSRVAADSPLAGSPTASAPGGGTEPDAQSDASGRPAPAAQVRGRGGASVALGNTWVPNAVVERVVDGDTLIARVGNRSETVRLIGVDAPESVAPTRPVQCFGREASLFLAATLPAGTEISLVRDVEARDVYDRLLGYVVRSSDGLFVNLALVADGYAAVLNYPPNDHYADSLSRAETEAQAAGRGLWSLCGGPDVPLE